VGMEHVVIVIFFVAKGLVVKREKKSVTMVNAEEYVFFIKFMKGILQKLN